MSRRRPNKRARLNFSRPSSWRADYANNDVKGHHRVHGDSHTDGHMFIDKHVLVAGNIFVSCAIEASAYQVNESTKGIVGDPNFDPDHVYNSHIVAGFVKNDAAGNFLFGQAGGGDGGGASALDQLTDVTLTSPVGREYLCFDSGSDMWVNQVIALDDLGDVVITSPVDGQSLVFDNNSSTWINKFNTSLDDLTDVTITAPAGGEYLCFDGSEWVNAAIPFTDLSDSPANYIGAGSQFVKVNAGATALEFSVAVLEDLDDVRDTTTGVADGSALVYRDSEGDPPWHPRLPKIGGSPAFLADTNVGVPTTSGSYLCFDVGQQVWIDAKIALDDLDNVSVASPNSGDHLEFNGSNWVNATPSGGGGVSELNDLSDVDLSTLTAPDGGAVLKVNNAGIWAQSDKIRLRQITDVGGFAPVIIIEGPFDPPTITNFAPALHFKTGLFGVDDPSIGVTGTLDDYNLKFFTKGAGTFILQPGGGNPTAGLLGVDSSGNILFGVSAGGAAELNDLSDVTLSSLAEGDFLRLNGSGQFVNTTLVDADVPTTLTLGQIFGQSFGLAILQFSSNVGATSNIEIANSASGTPVIASVGSSANLRLATSGGTFQLFPGGAAGTAGLLGLDSSGNIVFGQSAGGASALNDLSDVILTSVGPGEFLRHNGSEFVNTTLVDSDIPTVLTTIRFETSEGNEQLVFTAALGAVNFLNIISAATGNPVQLIADGDDTDVNLLLGTRGAGFYDFRMGSSGSGTPFGFGGEVFINSGHLIIGQQVGIPASIRQVFSIQHNGAQGSLLKFGYQQFEFPGAFTFPPIILELSSANSGAGETDLNVNYFRMQNAEATVSPVISALGADTDISIDLAPKGAGQVVSSTGFETSAGGAVYLGDPNTDGTWRFVRNASNLRVELREGGTYNSKGSFTP